MWPKNYFKLSKSTSPLGQSGSPGKMCGGKGRGRVKEKRILFMPYLMECHRGGFYKSTQARHSAQCWEHGGCSIKNNSVL